MRVIALGLVLAATGGCATGDDVRRPNVLLVTVDTLRADHVGCYGYPKATTPRADRLAAAGTRFVQAVAPIPETLPSIASIFTGTYPIDHGVRRNQYRLGPGPTLAEMLSENGWLTAAFVSSVVLKAGTGIERGFTLYDEELPHRFIRMEAGQRRAESTTDAARGWLERQAAAGRRDGIFLWVHYIDPHALYDAPPPHRDRFLDEPYTGNLAGGIDEFFGIVQGQIAVDDRDIRFLIDRYDGEIAYADANFGRLLDRLDELGFDDTLVIYTADHGESLGEHDYFFDHGEYLYENQIRVPLLLRHPDLPHERVVEDQVETLDILPTILDFLDIDPVEGLRGRSLLPLVHGRDDGPPRLAFSESDMCEEGSLRPCAPVGIGGKLHAVRADGWKLIHDPRGVYELYDLDADPGETHNRLTDQPELARKLTARLNEFLLSSASTDHTQELDPETIEMLRSIGYAR